MRAKLIRDDLEVSPDSGLTQEFISENSSVRHVLRNGAMRAVAFWKSGTVLSLPDSHYLVRMGTAVPDDDECRQRCGMSDDAMARAQHAYERLSRGIHPEDFALFDAGIIEGYNPDGSYKPGPNASQHPEVFAVADDEDDDE